VAVPERNAQKAAFEAFSEKQIEHVAGWKLMVEKWESDQSQPNPYEIPKSGMGNIFNINIFVSSVVIPRQIRG
jgi:hypothetical protein